MKAKKVAGYLSAAHYLLYWKLNPEERQQLSSHKSARYAASNQLERVKPGDVLWLINVYLGKLLLIGRIAVEIVVDDTEIAQGLVETWEGDWQEADWYAIASKYNTEPLRQLDITFLASDLRFAGMQDRLDLSHGIEANQLRSLRQLAPEGVRILAEFWVNQLDQPASTQDYLEFNEDVQAYTEGKSVVRTLKQRQRNRALVQDAKAHFRAAHGGRLFCQVCGFDFSATYGVEYIEAHHLQPIADLDDEQLNTREDVAMLCANCHRMVHSQTPPLSLEQLKRLIHDSQGLKHV